MQEQYRPELTYGIGITGHTRIDATRLTAPLKLILSSLHSQYQKLCVEYAASFSSGRLRLNSCLAYGTDQLAAQEALRMGYGLNAFLPFDRNDPRTRKVYSQELQEPFITALTALLKQADAVMELGEPSAELTDTKENMLRHAAFQTAGNAMLNNSDLLIAVWNGQPSENVGGTYQTLLAALKLHKAVILLDPEQPDRLQHYAYQERDFKPLDPQDLDTYLYATLKQLTPPTDKCLAVFRELSTPVKQPPFWAQWSRVYNRLSPKQRGKPVSARGPEPPRNALTELLERYDLLSGYYAELFRTFFVLAPVVGLITVTLSTLGLLLTSPVPTLVLNTLSLVVLLTFWGIYLFKEHFRWHQKLTEYRTLAETLRTQICLMQLGYTAIERHHPGIYDLSDFTWQQALIRIIVRAQGLPSSLSWGRDRDLTKAMLHSWLEGQMIYHRNNCHRSAYANARLQRWCSTLFVITVLLVIAGSVFSLPFDFVSALPALSLTLGVLGILVPLYATGIDAISKYAEFSLLAERSHGLAGTLQTCLDDLKHASGYAEVSEIARTCAGLMLGETLEWNIHYRRIEISK